ncbi:broad substrate specificity ATP-binding cassette transporter ABCG2-like isoform X2 [Antedon mediterranea]|uniref:broad substrate specificity ATP-binding cassette transporter ABCG2-like isoform X2 n=1 Tax=Antedon mediterranea TaxID=105859 RepID=UPI003AF7530A
MENACDFGTKTTDHDELTNLMSTTSPTEVSIDKSTVDKNGVPSSDGLKPRFGDQMGTVLSFHDLNYTVPAKVDGKKVNKFILKTVSGIFRPGMNAILGPSGSGKTSLLDVLAARKETRGLEGTVLIDGNIQPSNFKLVSGYVVQDDVVMGTLTIRENLTFSAALRLPSSLKSEDRNQRVDDVIRELGLEKCADTKVGTEFIRGVSGGERKRTNVGMELITRPEVLFLDEPTTGLDANTASSVMNLLSRLSKKGKTIIFSIHQPRYSIYRLFDTIHLLSLGQTVYHGPSCDVIEHFSSAGYVCETHNNPPDFFLDVINGDVQPESDDIEGGATLEGNCETNNSLVKHFLSSSHNTKLEEDLDLIWKNHNETQEVEIRKIEYQTSFFKQMRIVARRAFLNLLRNPEASLLQIIMLTVLALIVGIIFFDVDDSIQIGIQNRYGAFFFMTMNMVFSNMSAVQVFMKERVIFLHESANGFYRVSCYFLSKIFCDILPLRIFPTTMFAVITYWMIGLRAEATKFFIYLLNLLMTTLSAALLAFCVGARISTISVAMAIIPLCFILMLIFGGLFVNITSLPTWLQWLKWISIFRYSLNTLSINEFSGMVFVDGNMTVNGEDYLISQGIPTGTWGLWQNQLALFIMQIILLTLAYIQLRTVPKLK